MSLSSLQLFTSPFSGCTARVRIAVYLKGISDQIPLTFHQIDIAKGDQRSVEYTAKNPNASVPTLIAEYGIGGELDGQKGISAGRKKTDNYKIGHSTQKPRSITITQSFAILDFLEHLFPDVPLIPPHSDPLRRSRVLELANLVMCDIQPPQNSRIREHLSTQYGVDKIKYAQHVYERGLGVYEALARRIREDDGFKGAYSVGDEVTLADICLVPAVQGGLRVGIDLERWPLVKGIVEECWKIEAFRKGGVGEHGNLVP
jgi:maleylacetoacetate isomerase